MKIAVMGAGAVGCFYGGMLARGGHEVTLIGRPVHVEAITKRGGLRFESAIFDGVIPIGANTNPSAVAGADVVLFCVKSADTEEAGQQIAPHLKNDAVVISLQNGVDNAERLAAVLKQVVLPSVVYVAAGMGGPGHIQHHGRGDLIIGPSPRSDDIAKTFADAAIPTVVSGEVLPRLWDKLIINCAYNALSAIAQLPYGRLFEVEGTKEVMDSAILECIAVASELGIAVSPDIREKTYALVKVMPDQYASTAQDLARGRPTEIDFLNGHIVRKGAEFGIPTPSNLALQVAVKLRELERAGKAPR
ncbi:ketopantoate reductase family protein [Afipia sp. 1NLS2]|uniref:ketopantoate reductase family protein n=1 Tax=Afipia sp. 1NLS2 TaxID=666684 RepID=UPI0001D9F4F4|nr:ketopantoate reductase family protein [Afipia sp. 1NLS2]EFI52434.1 2-dehydropantoate 2-reductase [Afipia sp. 1NLS2]